MTARVKVRSASYLPVSPSRWPTVRLASVAKLFSLMRVFWWVGASVWEIR